MPHACHADHLVIFLSVTLRQVTVSYDQVILECFTHIVRIDEFQEALPVILRNVIVRIPGEALKIRKMDAFRCLIDSVGVSPVADSVILVQVDVIDAAVVRSECSYHFVLLLAALLLFEQLL